MQQLRRYATAALLLCGVLPAVAAAQGTRRPVARDFTDYREVEDAQISPDGSQVAYVVNDGKASIWVAAADGRSGPRRLTPADRAATSPRWSTDSRSVAFLSQGQIHLASLGGEVKQISKAKGSVSDFAWSPDGSQIAYTSAVPGASPPRSEIVTVIGGPATSSGATGYTALWLLDVASGETRRVTTPGSNIREFTWSPNGRQFAVLANGEAVGGGNVLAIVDRSGAVVRTLAKDPGSFGTRRQILDWSPDGGTIIYAKMSANNVGHWIGVVPAGGGTPRELLADYDGTVMKAVWAADSKHLIVQTFEKLSSHVLRVDAATGNVSRLAEAYTSYPDFTVSRDGETIAYLGETNTSPLDVWVHRAGQPKPLRLTRLNPELDDLRLGAVSELTYKSSRDTTTLYAVLVTPPGYTTGQKYPAIVQIHGGPHFHWGLGWLGDWHDWAQMLASHGYVVLLPNPRGSTGRSWDFANGIGGDMGGVDYQDIMDGSDALVARGIADPERLGVGGWSWGGYLTSWTVTQTDRFKAAVMGAGISNFFSFAGVPGIGRTDMDFRFGGDAYTRREALEQSSPMTFVRNVKTPTMIVHGENDAKITPLQAWEFYTALDHLGVDAQLVLYKRAGHGISNREQQRDLLERVLCWYDSHLDGEKTTCRL